MIAMFANTYSEADNLDNRIRLIRLLGVDTLSQGYGLHNSLINLRLEKLKLTPMRKLSFSDK